MNYLALAKLLGGLVAAAIIVAAVTWLVKHELAVHHDAAAFQACEGVAGGGVDSKKRCPHEIADPVDAGRRQASCDAALIATREAGGVPTLCTAPVQAAVTERDAGRRTIADQAGQLLAARQDTEDAVRRATARATTIAQRKANAAQVLASAPLDSGGHRICDAGCLRSLAGPPSPGP